jgi:hypothetical protein
MRSKRIWGLIIVTSVMGSAAAVAGETPSYPPPQPLKDDSLLGLHIQRTMTLLATSTPKHHNKVRILFYGQSITEQDWWKHVADDLRKRFPNADLEIENRAIGGFAAQLLIRPAEHDLYPFYPDLLIFHVYGANKEYEDIIRATRSRITAEVLMQRDHVTKWPPEVIDEKKDKGMWWDDLMNNHLLPEIAKKYGCGLADVRGQWLDYLKTNQLEPKDLLKDGVHLNAHGNYLMAQLIERYLKYRPDLPDDEWKDLVKTYEVGKDVAWKDGKLILPFDGNRVDVLAAKAEGKSAAARVRIDGKKPSEFPGTYRITRPQPGPWSPLTVARIDHDAPLTLEEWTLKITSVNADLSAWDFNVTGSATGADGAGSSAAAFTSKSGRVRIEPGAWFHPNGAKIPVGYEIKWKVLPLFVDSYEAPKVEDETRDYATTLAQGLPNEKHTLEIAGDGEGVAPIRALRVYRPPAK